MITRNNYEDLFLLYLDNELSQADRLAVEKFITQNPDLKEYWESLRQTVITPDPAIVFPFRDSLYKEEKKKRSPWLLPATSAPMRLAAAALVAGVILLLLFFPGRIPQSTLPVTAATTPPAAQPPVYTAVRPSITTIKNDPAVTFPTALTSKEEQGAPGPVNAKLTGPKYKEDNREEVITRGNTFKEGTPGENTAREDIAKKDIVPAQAPEDAGKQAAMVMSMVRVQGSAPTTQTVPSIRIATLNNTAFAGQIISKSTTLLSEDDLSADAVSGKKNKLRGLFRKVSRALDKTANRDDDDDEHRSIQIGGFQIALK